MKKSNPTVNSLGFPQGLLGNEPMRLDVLFAQNESLALNKPAGVLVDTHPWYSSFPVLVDGINQQLKDNKPEFQCLNLHTKVKSVYSLEPQISGVALLGVGEGSVENLRNLYGSDQMQFVFELLVEESSDLDSETSCDLPLAIHSKEEKVLVSHKTGKKAETRFKRLGKYGKYALWQATTSYLRMHQVRVHAMEKGLRLVGEDLYNSVEPIYLSALKKGRFKGRSEETPLYEGIHLHLKSVSWQENHAEAPLPRRFQVLLNKLEQYLG